MRKSSKILLLAILFLLISTRIVFVPWFGITDGLYYWILLLYVIIISYLLNIKSSKVLLIALTLTALGGLFDVLSVNDIAERVLRIGFVFWIVGVVQSVIETINN